MSKGVLQRRTLAAKAFTVVAVNIMRVFIPIFSVALITHAAVNALAASQLTIYTAASQDELKKIESAFRNEIKDV